MWRRFGPLFFLGQALALPALQNDQFSAVPTPFGNPPATRDSEPFDILDLSWITKLAAIGDSYSAGIGAGDRLGSVTQIDDQQSDFSCSRYDHAYPYLVNQDERLGDPANRNFQFKSCSGAVTKDVLEKQIPAIDNDQQVILLSIGGNDAELSNILNQCIFQWAVFNKLQNTVAKLDQIRKFLTGQKFSWSDALDFDVLSRGCDGQLDYTQSIIEGGDFSKNIDNVLQAAKGKLAKDGMIYYTGYAKFFDEALSPECDNVSWNVWADWVYKSYNLFTPREKLTKDHRKRMNDLVDTVNAKLADAANRAGSNVNFVNYDSYFGKFSGRYCAPGVDESSVDSNTRDRLMFYELQTTDVFGTEPWKRDVDDQSVVGTFSGYQNVLAQITLLMESNATLATEDKLQIPDEAPTPAGEAPKVEPKGITEYIDGLKDFLPDDFKIPNLLPDGYGRVFHPQVLGHEIIANLVLYNMVNDNAKRNGKTEGPEVLKMDTCPVATPITAFDLGTQECKNAFDSHDDVHEDEVNKWAKFVCESQGAQISMGPDSNEIFWRPEKSGAVLNYRIRWVEGCQTTQDSQSPRFPLHPREDVHCQKMFYEDWRNCNNGGVGGSRTAGCLRYEFWAE